MQTWNKILHHMSCNAYLRWLDCVKFCNPCPQVTNLYITNMWKSLVCKLCSLQYIYIPSTCQFRGFVRIGINSGKNEGWYLQYVFLVGGGGRCWEDTCLLKVQHVLMSSTLASPVPSTWPAAYALNEKVGLELGKLEEMKGSFTK